MRTVVKEMAEPSRAAAKSSRLFKIGDLSKRSGIGIEALRFYERQGLLVPATRTGSGYRLYDEDAFERLDFIKRAQVLGFSLSEIARIMQEKAEGKSPCSEVREIVRRRLQELDERIKEMQRYREELASALTEWDAAGDVEGHICGLIEGRPVPPRRPVNPVRIGKGQSK